MTMVMTPESYLMNQLQDQIKFREKIRTSSSPEEKAARGSECRKAHVEQESHVDSSGCSSLRR